MAPLHASHANKKMQVGTMHKFALNKPPPVATWAISRQNAHNDAPQVERRRGPRALQTLPTDTSLPAMGIRSARRRRTADLELSSPM